jgi:hypothetical protein
MSEAELRNILDNYTILRKEESSKYGDCYYRERYGDDWCSVKFLPDDCNERLSQFGGKRYDGKHVQIGHLYDGISLTYEECVDRLKKHLRGHFYYGEPYLKPEFNNWFSEDFVFIDRPTIKSRVEGEPWERILIKDFKYDGELYKDGHVLYANLDGSLKCRVSNDKFYCGINDVDFPYDVIEKNYKTHQIVQPVEKEKDAYLKYGGGSRFMFKDTNSYLRYLADDSGMGLF